MSQYMQELSDALSRVLDRCAQLDRRRLAGYAQNIDFWVAEIQHRLALIDGYIDRRRNMLAGTDAAYAYDIQRNAGRGYNPGANIESLTTPNAPDTSTNWDELEAEAAGLRKQVLSSARRFVMKCLDTELIDQDKLFQIEDVLGVNLRSRKPWIAS